MITPMLLLCFYGNFEFFYQSYQEAKTDKTAYTQHMNCPVIYGGG
jgi:hypothetical protein